MKRGDYAAAVDDYTRALQLKPDGEVRAQRGWAYFFAGAPAPASRDFDEAVRLDPGGGDAHVGRGLARVTLGPYRDAVADAEEALRRVPETAEMLHDIACVFAQAVGRLDAEPRPPDRGVLVARYRGRAVATIRRALDRLPAGRRRAFWRETVLPARFLDPIRQSPEFRALACQLGADHVPPSP